MLFEGVESLLKHRTPGVMGCFKVPVSVITSQRRPLPGTGSFPIVLLESLVLEEESQ